MGEDFTSDKNTSSATHKTQSEYVLETEKQIADNSNVNIPKDNGDTLQLPPKAKDMSGTQMLGTLYVTLHKAKNLDKKDIIGTADPYATIKYGDTRFKAAVKKNTSNPEWNFEVDFKIHENYPKEIKIELFDKDTLGKDESLGDTTLSVQELMEKTPTTNNWKSLSNSELGEILYSVKFSPHEEKMRKKSSVKTS